MLGEFFYYPDMRITPIKVAAAVALAEAINELNEQIRVGLTVPVRIGRPHNPGALDDVISLMVENLPGYRKSNAVLFSDVRGGVHGDVFQEEELFSYQGKDLRFGTEEFIPEASMGLPPTIIYTIAA